VSEEQSQQPQVASGERQPGQKKRARVVREEALRPNTSLWPFALAVAIVVILVGVMTNPVVLGLGAALVVAAVIGWSLERVSIPDGK
jgi:hypothetical protein